MRGEAIIREVARVADVELSSTIRTLHESLGFQMVGGIEAEARIIRGIKAFQAFIGSYYPGKYQHVLNTNLNTDNILGTIYNGAERTEIDAVINISMTAWNVGRIMALGKKKVYKKIGQQLVTQLGENDESRQHAAFLINAAVSMASAAYIKSTAERGSDLYFFLDQHISRV